MAKAKGAARAIPLQVSRPSIPPSMQPAVDGMTQILAKLLLKTRWFP